MSAWSHLPNARHIDRVLASLKKHPRIWDAAWDAAGDVARRAAWSAVDDVAFDEAWGAIDGVAGGAAAHAAWDAILALFVYDDCDQYLDMTSEELKAWALMTEHPAAVLLLSAVIAFERIKKMESV
jgi:hypothetical protein